MNRILTEQGKLLKPSLSIEDYFSEITPGSVSEKFYVKYLVQGMQLRNLLGSGLFACQVTLYFLWLLKRKIISLNRCLSVSILRWEKDPKSN